MSHLLFVFVDGVGLGPDDPSSNPLAQLALPAFERLAGDQRWTMDSTPRNLADHVFRTVDANLDVDGLPQSGTGQATLFTGVNCAQIVGRHFGPYPHSQTKPVLASKNIFVRLQALGLPFDEPSAFVNAYPPRFFSLAERRNRWTVTTRCCLDANLRIRTLDDLQAHQALTADLTGQAWRDKLALDVEVIAETEAGARFVQIGRQHAITLFEYFLTDKAGHSRSFDRTATVLRSLDRFFTGILDRLDSANDLLLVTSDHGNIEDLSTKTHTRHPVPLVAYGAGAEHFADIRDLTEITPAVIEWLRAAYGSRSREG